MAHLDLVVVVGARGGGGGLQCESKVTAKDGNVYFIYMCLILMKDIDESLWDIFL